MKLISAVITPNVIDRVCAELLRAKVTGMTVLEGKGYGREDLRGDPELSGYLNPRLIVEVVISDERCDEIVALIKDAAATGEDTEGAGVIFVVDVHSFVRI